VNGNLFLQGPYIDNTKR